MTARARPVSRRWFIGAGAVIACSGLPPCAQAQTAPDGFRVLRAVRRCSRQASGYDGTVPGPTLRVGRGEELRVRLVNDLATPTSVHWHGIRLPNAMDGVPALTQPPWHPAQASITAFGRPTPARSGTTPMLPARPIGVSPAHSSSRTRSRSTSIATLRSFSRPRRRPTALQFSSTDRGVRTSP